MGRKDGRRKNGMAAEAFHQRFLYLFDEALGKLLRDNPDVEQRVNHLTAELFEIMAAGLRKQAAHRK